MAGACTIATWNVNSVRARLANVVDWLRDFAPEVLLLQELKVVSEGFPREPFEDLGYNVAVFGQKSWNGVAILSKRPIDEVRRGLAGGGEEEARYMEALVPFGGGVLRVASVYAPNGNPVGSDKFARKLAFMEGLCARACALLDLEEVCVLGGDYNVLERDDDAYDVGAFEGDALGHDESKVGLRRLLHMGWTDAFRLFHEEGGAYSYWDYKGGAFGRDEGLLIDRLLLSPRAVDCVVRCDIDGAPRGEEKASDHTPVVCVLREP